MTRRVSWLFAGLVLTFSLAPPVLATDLTRGLVLLKTSSIEPMIWQGVIGSGQLVEEPVPNDEISDLRLVLGGVPFGSPFDSADVVVRIDNPVHFDDSQQTIPVATTLQGISLASLQPVILTYHGANPEIWDVRICMSRQSPQLPGTLQLTNDCDNSGTFTHVLFMKTKATFRRRSDGLEVPLDLGLSALIGHGYWSTLQSTTGSYATVPPNSPIDGDCDGAPDVRPPNDPLPGSSNLVLGVARVNCNARDTDVGFEAVRPMFYGLKSSLVLEPATQDDRIILLHQSALPGGSNPLAVGGLTTLSLLGLASVFIRPRG